VDTPRVNIRRTPGQFYPNEIADFEWVGQHRPELLERYGPCVIPVYNQELVGVGKTIRAAMEDAEEKLPTSVAEITPIIDFLGHRHSLYRVQTQST
jgi:histidinol phosphatase-like enzyme